MFKNLVRTLKWTQHFTITKISVLMLFKELIYVFSRNRTRLRSLKHSYWLLKHVVHIVPTGLWKIKHILMVFLLLPYVLQAGIMAKWLALFHSQEVLCSSIGPEVFHGFSQSLILLFDAIESRVTDLTSVIK
jgi:hypothetical protein